VAEAKTPAKQAGLTRGKAILIGILSVVLVVVLYIQFGGKSDKPAGGAVAYRPPRPALAVQPANAPTQPPTLASAKISTNGPTSMNKTAIAAALVDDTRWKSPKLEKIVAYDPFALPPAFPQPKVANGKKANGAGLIAAVAANDAKKLAEAAEKLRVQLEELTQQGVHVIVREGDQYVAWIGERKLQVGDKINGFTVTAIDTDGVHIERKESP
jgi:hypothetical protein